MLLLIPCSCGGLQARTLQTSGDAPSLALQQPLHISAPCLAPYPWRTAGGCTKASPAHLMCCCTRALSPFLVKLLLQGKPVIKSSLVPTLLEANCSVHVLPRSLRKPARLAGCSTSLPHVQNDALQHDDGTKISLQTYLTRLVVGFGFGSKHLFFKKNKKISSTQKTQKEKYL